MPFPNPQLLTTLLDHYIGKRKDAWNSYSASVKSFFGYKGEREKTLICDNLKKDFTSPIDSNMSEMKKWMKICIDLGEKATSDIQAYKKSYFGQSMMQAKYFHAMRTYILTQIQATSNSKTEFQACIKNMINELPEDQRNSDKTLLTLVHLGDDASLAEARKKNLLSMYDFPKADSAEKPSYLELNYFATKFFEEELKPNSEYKTFDDFEKQFKPVENLNKEIKEEPKAKASEPKPEMKINKNERPIMEDTDELPPWKKRKFSQFSSSAVISTRMPSIPEVKEEEVSLSSTQATSSPSTLPPLPVALARHPRNGYQAATTVAKQANSNTFISSRNSKNSKVESVDAVPQPKKVTISEENEVQTYEVEKPRRRRRRNY